MVAHSGAGTGDTREVELDLDLTDIDPEASFDT